MLNRPIALAVLGACLLPACTSLPARMQLMFQPAQQVRHAGGDVASSYYRLGRYHQEHGDLELALTAYTYAIARDPRHAGARSAAAAIHAQQGRLAQARAMLLAVAADYPALAQPHNNLGYLLHLQGDYAAAAAAFRRALAIEPANERARNNLALADSAAVAQIAAAPAAAPAPAQIAAASAAMAPAAAATAALLAAAAAPVVAPAPAAPTPPPSAPARMDLVQLAPNVYQLTLVEPPAPVAAPLPASARVMAASRLEVANGNGVSGIARRVKLSLARRGIAVARLTNARPFSHAATSIEFRQGFEQQALRLQAAMGGTPVLKQVPALSAQADLRLVLGKDARDGRGAPRVIAAQP